MRHQNRKKRLNRKKAHRESMIRNIAMNVIIHEKVKTTEAKAKVVTAFIDKLINAGRKENKMHAIRELGRLINHENCSKKIMEELIERYKDRKSGYTRVTKLGNRPGDNAPMVLIELI
jgi:large subunit ribosomal protein L17